MGCSSETSGQTSGSWNASRRRRGGIPASGSARDARGIARALRQREVATGYDPDVAIPEGTRQDGPGGAARARTTRTSVAQRASKNEQRKQKTENTHGLALAPGLRARFTLASTAVH